jgi:DNA-binding transcriptional LysR family regulator
MSINTDSLKAFLLTSELSSFTKAALELGLSQSALSQKIARLEDLIEATLFIRKSDGIELTPAGEKLLVFARQQLQLQDEFLENFKSGKDGLSGHLRIAGFSSIMRSMVIPTLSPWLKAHPGILIEFSTQEVNDLADILKTNQADMILTDYFPKIPGVEEVQIGEEEYVLIESKRHKNIPNIFLDNYPADNATESFFSFQGKKYEGARSFMGDVYGILDGVALGLGKAVMSKHLIENDARFKIIKSSKRYIRPIVLSHFKQSYYPAIQKQAKELLIKL